MRRLASARAAGGQAFGQAAYSDCRRAPAGLGLSVMIAGASADAALVRGSAVLASPVSAGAGGAPDYAHRGPG